MTQYSPFIESIAIYFIEFVIAIGFCCFFYSIQNDDLILFVRRFISISNGIRVALNSHGFVGDLELSLKSLMHSIATNLLLS